MKFTGFTSLQFPIATLLILSLAAACGDDTPEVDAGVADTGARDATTPFDSGVRDTGVRDTGVADAGRSDSGMQAEYCVQNGIIDSEGGDIDLGGAASSIANNATGNRANVSCIDRGPPTALLGNIRFEGCLIFAGAAPTRAALEATLDAALFYEVHPQTAEVIDPSFDPVTGLNRGTPLGVTIEVRDNAPQCDSGLQLEIGAQAPGVFTDVPYTFRVRSSTTGGEWMTTYVQGILARADIAGGGGCTPGTCRFAFNLPLARRSEVQAMITASGVNIPGSANLDDGQGPGYALLAARDCTDSAMENAVVGFSTAPAAEGYLSAQSTFDAALDATSASGLYAGLGFTITSSLGATVHGGVGVRRFENECTEGFGRRAFRVYPDALSLVFFGRETVFNQ